MMIPQGVRSPVRSATSDKVNITIWNGTTMVNTQNKYNSFVNLLFTRAIYHAHIEVHTRITRTEPTVINTVQPTALSNSICVNCGQEVIDSFPCLLCRKFEWFCVVNTLFLNELISTIRIGIIYTTPMIANDLFQTSLIYLFFSSLLLYLLRSCCTKLDHSDHNNQYKEDDCLRLSNSFPSGTFRRTYRRY